MRKMEKFMQINGNNPVIYSINDKSVHDKWQFLPHILNRNDN